MERTNLLEERGRQLFICKKKDVQEVSDFLDKELQKLYQSVVPSGLKFDRMPVPKHNNHKITRAIGSYADVLAGFANPQDVPESHILCTSGKPFSSLTNPIRAKKHTIINLNANSNPETSSDTNVSSIQTNPSQTNYSNNSTKPTTGTDTVSKTEFNSTLDIFRQEMKAAQEASLSQFCANMEQCIDNKLTTIITDMRNGILSNVQSIMDTTMDKILANTQQLSQNLSDYPMTPHKQGNSSPDNTAAATSRIEQSSTTGASNQ
eukprot:3868567-Ditylum_brightwellii.AAC.1